MKGIPEDGPFNTSSKTSHCSTCSICLLHPAKQDVITNSTITNLLILTILLKTLLSLKPAGGQKYEDYYPVGHQYENRTIPAHSW